MNDLTLVVVSKLQPYSIRFLLSMQAVSRYLGCEFLVAADGDDALFRANEQLQHARLVPVHSRGYLESVHDEAISAVMTPYVLRLDDDEKASPAMVDWLMDRAYRACDHWKFPRANLWTPTAYISSAPLWPDHQTRLSVKKKALGRTAIHAGSPHGGGRPAPVAIEHYKFVVKSRAERLQIAHQYDKVLTGGGTGGMKVFNLPEDVYTEIPLEAWRDGTVDCQ
jgi:hypothetical protein